ncbi:MAG: AMP-binding protein [Sphaerochaeta sp.]|jgi:long-chain acyl-CoA synthetase|nr:AMP-binding protein [Sphaerochaeta sp.]MCH3920976.1 AMP-binding protein [Sphaerochaeta sp.]MCI2075860.1 AMP-binding protein [Sphaerochaeta sp.]MCI2097126.1 AMP-binding protein [Sphaerochaeta sp.]MCI2104849.1 AMP-binding protein [Sphaerochaeta sp.]
MSKGKGKKIRWTKQRIKRIKRSDGLRPKLVDAYTMRSVITCAESRYGHRVALSVWRDERSEITYTELNRMSRSVGMYLLDTGLSKGDRIAIIGESCPSWFVLYLGATGVGIVAVPVLPEFSADDIQNIITVSNVKMVAVAEKQFEKVKPGLKEGMRLVRLEDLFEIPRPFFADLTDKKDFAKAPGNDMSRYKPKQDSIRRWEESAPSEEDLASLIFTSGTTGRSKGVLLTHRNLVWNADVCTDLFFLLKPGYHVLSILPMSHVYEFTTGQVLPLLCGCHIVYLGRMPAPSILMPALAEVRPQIIMTVPLLMEKVYKSSVKPVLENPKLKRWLFFPPMRKFIYRIVGRKIKLAFGGKLKFYGIGGAPLDKTVESFLRDAKFPYAEGYGLTETSPMICGHGPTEHYKHMLGRIVPGETVKLDQPNAEGVGEILVKGPNVMTGYYENDALNKESFTEDGFFRTGDLGKMDRRGRLGLRGRTKTMILGSGGENIYPEIIETLINEQDFVTESLVVAQDGGLSALVKLDLDSYAKQMAMNMEDAKKEAKKYLANLRLQVNRSLSSYSKISSVELQEEPFERTPTMKIKRFLYGKKKEKTEQEKQDNG